MIKVLEVFTKQNCLLTQTLRSHPFDHFFATLMGLFEKDCFFYPIRSRGMIVLNAADSN